MTFRSGIREQGGLLAIGFVVVLVMSLSSIWLIRETAVTTDRTESALTFTNLLANLRADIRRAESGQRGYILTGDATYLRDYEAAVGRVGTGMSEALSLAAGDPAQRDGLGAVNRLVEEKLAELAQTVGLTQDGRRAEALSLIRGDSGLLQMQAIASGIVAATRHEHLTLVESRKRADLIQLLLFVINLAGGLVIALLAALSIVLVRRGAAELTEAHAALERANAELERRVAERTADLQEANGEIQRYAYIVSHDLRAPLVNIMGFTSELEALRDDLFARAGALDGALPVIPAVPAPSGDDALAKLREEFDEALRFIKTSISKMDRLINAILQLSRVGRREFKAQRIDLNEMVGALVADFGHRAQQAQTEITIGRLPTIVSDRLALEQIISNLLDNAVKYLRRDVPGRIEVTAQDHGPLITLSVADNGRGIEAKDMERIFDLFRRAGAQDRPGDGIGLAHVRTLARLIGGAIRVDSRPNDGSVFLITLPKAWTPANAKSGGE
jgi:signal transduction histidine kinase